MPQTPTPIHPAETAGALRVPANYQQRAAELCAMMKQWAEDPPVEDDHTEDWDTFIARFDANRTACAEGSADG